MLAAAANAPASGGMKMEHRIMRIFMVVGGVVGAF